MVDKVVFPNEERKLIKTIIDALEKMKGSIEACNKMCKKTDILKNIVPFLVIQFDVTEKVIDEYIRQFKQFRKK